MLNTLLNLIPGGGLTVMVGALMAVLAAFGIVARKATVAERNRNLAQEAAAREKHLREMADAAAAKPTGSVSDDPNNRDNREKDTVHNLVDRGGIQRPKR